MGHLIRNCPDLNDEEKEAIVQAFKNKSGQAHVNIGAKQQSAANKELQECLDGVANVNVNFDDASIQSMDEHCFFDSVGFVSLTGVVFVAPGTKGGRMDCGRNKLFLDSCATQHTMFAIIEYLTRLFLSKVNKRQN
jgi:hypothetical protein